MGKDGETEETEETGRHPWSWYEQREWAQQAQELGVEGMAALRAKRREEMVAAGQEVAHYALKLAWDTYQACEGSLEGEPGPRLMETFWKMQIPVLTVRTWLRFFAWDRANSQGNSQVVGSEEAGDDDHEE